MKKSKKKVDNNVGKEKEDRIKSLEDLIMNAQQTIADAQLMLTQLKKDDQNSSLVYSAPRQQTPMPSADGQIIHGTFDGQIMIGEDDKQYPVPANYASKSKLVEGDMLKLTITPEGNFVYKQIGPAQRRYLIGVVQRDEKGNYSIIAEGKKFKVLLAAATYFKIEPGDEVTLVVPKDGQSQWAAIENVLKKASEMASSTRPKAAQPENFNDSDDSEEEDSDDDYAYQKPSAIEKLEREMEMERRSKFDPEAIANEWTPDIEALKKEARQRVGAENQEE